MAGGSYRKRGTSSSSPATASSSSGVKSKAAAPSAPSAAPTSAHAGKAHPSTFELVLNDLIATAAWVAGSSIFQEVASYLHRETGLSELWLNIALLVAGLHILGSLSSAIINPVLSVAMLIRGRGGLLANLCRLAGQLVGACLGTYVAVAYVPLPYQSKFKNLSGGLQEGVSLLQGFACEASLVFIIIVLFLFTLDLPPKGPARARMVTLASHLSTVLVVAIGSEYTGPSLNPYYSLSWNLVYDVHETMEHVVVFWMGPLTGAVAAALLWKMLAASIGLASDGVQRRSGRDLAAGKAARKALRKDQ